MTDQPITPPGQPPKRSARPMKKDTRTWQLFERLFLSPTATYPLVIPNIPRGEAINLAMGLNRCNIQFAEEQNLPPEFIQLSAKARKGETDSSWSLEISRNQRYQGRRSAAPSWMDKYFSLGDSPESHPPLPRGPQAALDPNTSTLPAPLPPEDLPLPAPSPLEALLAQRGYVPGGAGGDSAPSDEANAASGRVGTEPGSPESSPFPSPSEVQP